MTCKDCIHYEVCKKTRIMNLSHNYAAECNDYKDRSRFVELQTAHWIRHCPDKNIMRKFHKQGIGRGMGENSIFWTCSNCGGWGILSYKYCPFCGAKIKEAEQALKERIENDA